jgi:eukaryotic-like serine/threonine-protein kinase
MAFRAFGAKTPVDLWNSRTLNSRFLNSRKPIRGTVSAPVEESSNQEQYREGDEIPGTGYTYVRELGEGGQGIVFEVRDPYLDTLLVMKVLTLELAFMQKNQDHVREEARALAKLSNPHIVSVFRGGFTTETPSRPYFMMPKLEGDTLQALLSRKRQLAARDAIFITLQILDGLDAAHNHPTHRMVHRDIKPGNIFLHRASKTEVRAVILDFGISRLIDRARSAKTADSFAGTFEYAAPEQYSGSGVLPETDLYAVAGLLFQMLTGRLVFPGESRMEIAKCHLMEVPPRLSTLVLVPQALDALVAQGLEKDPTNRPRSAKEFSAALRKIRDELERNHAEASLPSGKDPPTAEMSREEWMRAAERSPRDVSTAGKPQRPSAGMPVPTPMIPGQMPAATVDSAAAQSVGLARTEARQSEGPVSPYQETNFSKPSVDRGAATRTSGPESLRALGLAPVQQPMQAPPQASPQAPQQASLPAQPAMHAHPIAGTYLPRPNAVHAHNAAGPNPQTPWAETRRIEPNAAPMGTATLRVETRAPERPPAVRSPSQSDLPSMMHLSQPGSREPTQVPPSRGTHAGAAQTPNHWTIISYVVLGIGLLVLAASFLVTR